MKKNISKYIKVLGAICCVYLVCVLLLGSVNKPVFAEQVATATTGVLNYDDGSMYIGDILNGTIRNGSGTFIWPDQQIYDGTWAEDSINGTGKMVWNDFGEYTGDFVNQKREGQGTFTWIYSDDIAIGAPIYYTGAWVNDKIDGYGKLKLNGIGVYEGNFAKQKRSGDGKFTWDNGDVYEGKWASDKISGEGELRISSDGTILKGTFSNGAITNGTITYKVDDGIAERNIVSGRLGNNVTLTYSNGTTITGKLNNNEFYGTVKILYGDTGDTYEGAIKNGVKEGKGTYTWKNGAHYIGEWDNDMMSGTGKYYYGKEEKKLYLTGTFLNGKPNGKLTYVADNGLRYETTWSNGTCTNIAYKKN